MKRLATSTFLLVISPILLASVSVGDNNADNTKHIQFPTDQSPVVAPDSISLTNSDFGIEGPLSFSTQYSQLYGIVLSGQYTQLLGTQNALSLILEGGKNEARGNLTWGYAPTANQRIKLTGEYLSQHMDFDYYAGDISRWEGQQAYGAGYEYIVSTGLLNNINIDTYYSRANTQNLDNVDYEGATNLRRIAGGEDKSASTGIDLLPTQSTLLGLKLNYDDVIYNTKYENDQNTVGFGATVSLEQLITQHLKLQLAAADRNPINTYSTEIDYLVHTTPGSRLELALTAERDIAQGTLSNDSRVGLNLNYAWGGRNTATQKSEAIYTLGAATTADDMKSWTANPAVKMSQVLAVADQTVELPTQTNHTSLLGACPDKSFLPTQNNHFTVTTIQISPSQKFDNQDLGVLSDENPAASNTLFVAPNAFQVYHVNYNDVSVSNATGLTFTAAIKPGTKIYHLYLSGTVKANPSTIVANIVGLNRFTDQDPSCILSTDLQNITLQAGPPPVPTINFTPDQSPANPWILNMGSPFPTSSHTGTYTPMYETVNFGAAAGGTLESYGITPNASNGNITFTGTPTKYTTQVESFSATVVPAKKTKLSMPGHLADPSPTTLSLVILTPPVGDSALVAGGSYVQGAAITATPFAGHFKDILPNYDGNINNYAICTTNQNPQASPSTCAVAGSGTEYGLSIDQNGVLSGNVTPAPGNYQLYIFASNVKMGWNNVTPETPSYQFSVSAVPKPSVVLNPTSQPWLFTSSYPAATTPTQTMTVNAGADNLSIQSMTITPQGSSIPLESLGFANDIQACIAAKTPTCTIHFSVPDVTKTRARDDVQSYEVTVTNSAEQSLPQPVTLNVGVQGSPENPQAQDMGTFTYHPGDTIQPVNFSEFMNPISSGTLVYDLCDNADAATTGTCQPIPTDYHLTVTGHTVTGNILSSAAVTSGHPIYIFAHNDFKANPNVQKPDSFTIVITQPVIPAPTLVLNPTSQPWLFTNSYPAATTPTQTMTVNAGADNLSVQSMTITPQGSSTPLESLGFANDIQACIAAKTPTCTIHFSVPDVNKTMGTMATQSYQIMVTNSAGKSLSEPVALGVDVQGSPENKQTQDLGTVTYHPGDTITPVAFTAFNNPTPASSGTVVYDLCDNADAATSGACQPIPADYQLSVSGNTITGKILSTAAETTGHLIYVFAHNNFKANPNVQKPDSLNIVITKSTPTTYTSRCPTAAEVNSTWASGSHSVTIPSTPGGQPITFTYESGDPDSPASGPVKNLHSVHLETGNTFCSYSGQHQYFHYVPTSTLPSNIQFAPDPGWVDGANCSSSSPTGSIPDNHCLFTWNAGHTK